MAHIADSISTKWHFAWRESSHRLAHAADAPRHGPHDVEGEVRHFIDHEAKFALVDHGQFAVLLDAGGGAPRRAVDHRHESDRFVGSANLDHLVADHHLDHAGLHDIHASARIALVEDHASGTERHVGAGASCKHLHVNVIAVHFRLTNPSRASIGGDFMPKILRPVPALP